MAQPVRTSEHSKCTFQPKWPNHPWLALGWLKVEQGQNPHKTTWLKLTFGRPQKLYFDLVVRTGWNQCHCECHQIISPTTIHGSKSKLERPRFHENWDNVPINALLTSGSHNFWSDRWIFKFHTFSETGSQDLSKGPKINPVQGLLKVEALEGPSPRKGQQKCGSWQSWKDLDFLFLKKYGSWKSNSWIKSYGSRKLVMHQLVRYPGFHDISTVLTLISTHE